MGKTYILYKGYKIYPSGRIVGKRGKVLKPHINGGGYKRVFICGKRVFVHKLVAELFIPNPHGYKIVNHKDENKLNCKVSNLEWCDIQYNTRYSIGRSVIRINLEDSSDTSTYACMSDVTEDGYAISCVSACCRKIQKTHLGCKWMYAEEYEEREI